MGVGRRYGLEIRNLTAADAPGLAEMLAAAGRPVTGTDLSGRLDQLRHSAGTALIALEWGPPSGIVVLQAVHDLAAARPAGLIATLAVAPDARRRGIGRLLVKAVSRSARLAGCDRLLLVPDAGAAGLADFAAATGFLPEGGLLVRPLLRRGPQAE